MQLTFQPDTLAFYRHFNPSHPCNVQDWNCRAGLSGLSATDQQITAAFGTIGSQIPIAGPFIAAAASIAITIENLFSGCGQTCVQTSSAANQAGSYLTQNVQNYIANPIRTVSMQAAALSAFDRAWAALEQSCGNSQYGAAGQRCISDRQRGGCTWKTSPGGWNPDGTYTWAGAAGSGTTCWNWFVGMRDPIANDPFVVPDSIVAGPIVDNTTSSSNTVQVSTAGGATNGPTTADAVLNQSVAGVPLPLILIGGGLLLLMAVSR